MGSEMCIRDRKLLEHEMKIGERVLERRMRRMTKVDEMHSVLCQAKEQ